MNLLSDPALSQTCVCRHIARGHGAHQSQGAPNATAQVYQCVGGPGFTSGSTADNPRRVAIRLQHTSSFSPSAAATARYFGEENRVLSNVGGGGQKGRAAHLAGRSEKGKKKNEGKYICLCAERLFGGERCKMSPGTSNYGKPQMARNNKNGHGGALTQIECSQTREATDERLSLGKPATHPIGTVDKLGRAAPLTARGAAGKKQSAPRVDVQSSKQYVLPSVCLDLLTCCQHRGHFGVCVCVNPSLMLMFLMEAMAFFFSCPENEPSKKSSLTTHKSKPRW